MTSFFAHTGTHRDTPGQTPGRPDAQHPEHTGINTGTGTPPLKGGVPDCPGVPVLRDSLGSKKFHTGTNRGGR